MIRKTIKLGKVSQLVEAKDTHDGDIKVVKIYARSKVLEEDLNSEVEWLKDHLCELPYQ